MMKGLAKDMLLQESFYSHFPNKRMYGTVHCPYRVCPLGAHVDHQHGLVSGFALGKGVSLAYATLEEPIIELYSMNFEGMARFAVQPNQRRANDWGDYARAVVNALFEHGYDLRHGFCGVLEGTLPIGGLSSSAAVVLACMVTLCRVNGIGLQGKELIDMASVAERKYMGLNNGKLDQSCEVYCQKDHLLYLDTMDGSFENIRQHQDMPAYRIGIFFSGVSRALIHSAYNARVDECRAAAYFLKAYAGLPYEKIADVCLRDVPEDVFRRHRDRLPESFGKRAEHFYAEQKRVRDGMEAWRRGDIHRFGEMVFQSGNSSIENYESGSPELRTLHEIMLDTTGIYGGRFSGAGFKGCCMALVDPAYEEQIAQRITEKYLAVFPELRDKFAVYFCETADGVKERVG